MLEFESKIEKKSVEAKETENRFCGRILRGVNAEEFETLTDNPQRRVVFLLPGSELGKIKDIKDDYQKLKEVGWSDAEIEGYIKKSKKFKILEFPASSEFAKPATWDNLIEIVCQAYPDLADKIKAQVEALKSTPYAKIFESSKLSGPMTQEKYVASNGGLAETRAFLRDTLNVNEQFAGDGYTRTSEGKKGVLELVALNRKISEIPGAKITDLDVNLPSHK